MKAQTALTSPINPEVVVAPPPNLHAAHFFLFRAKSDADKKMLFTIIRDTDPRFMKWAVSAILDWNNTSLPSNLYSIHGADDRILPARKLQPDVVIPGAGHLVVYLHGDKLTQLILEKFQAVYQ